MALPMLAHAGAAILRRYGLKALDAGGKNLVKRRVAIKARAKKKGGADSLSGKTFDKKVANSRRLEVAGNVLGDASLAGLAAESVHQSIKLDEFATKAALRKQVKAEYPDLWKQFTASEHDNIKTFLKAEGVFDGS